MKKIIFSFIVLVLVAMSVITIPVLAATNPINIETSPDKVLFNVENMKPGDWAEKELTIQNRGEEDFAYNAVVDFKGGSEKLFKEFSLEIHDKDGSLYDGKLSEFQEFDARFLETMHEEKLNLVVSFPPELGNDFQGLSFEVEIKFVAEQILGDEDETDGETQTPIDPTEEPVDGDILPSTATNTFNYLLIGGLIVIVGGILFYLNKRKQRV
ncbi:LPXTG cell wall anchor domain-containing protein [Aquibacillus koreensis]|uniref:LPXTG cell wall anchor domain-containing protein n=1 Tax=Aquibacillus koreensis TaxID=279446 RepID=A0A9X3WM00_9BACI|nr:LPXTG cell wall anchor domain-containing protein [Aquibacillus koreensis]MCT2534620.1 LPXTG cell wall anchor domain-containing protein [Aquibacillus koreensis]MDC3419804.1 LPXTG cell wall anchor domain-containing protein [Aquibacillus koreensis]